MLPDSPPTAFAKLRLAVSIFVKDVGKGVFTITHSGPFLLGQLSSTVFAGSAEPMRPAGLLMCLVFLLGLAVLPFLPETKGRPLPE